MEILDTLINSPENIQSRLIPCQVEHANDVQTNVYKRIALLYDATLAHLALARKAILLDDPAGRGTNLGQAIELISELDDMVKDDSENESTAFLRGLYMSILCQLPMANRFNDTEIVDRAIRYIRKLQDLWLNVVRNAEKIGKN